MINNNIDCSYFSNIILTNYYFNIYKDKIQKTDI
jgi:hypothetical protein